MIYTITLNPALDYFMDYSNEGAIKKFARTKKSQLQFGGKGINASALLNNIEVENKALILTGGLTGKILLESLESEGINYINFDTKNEVRINVKAQFDDTYELLSDTSNNNDQIKKELLDYVDANVKVNDLVMIMGSQMDGLPGNIIDLISTIAKQKGAELVYDMANSKILELLKHNPLVIKPNVSELENIFGIKINGFDDIKKYAKQLIEKGAQNVIVSQDSKGAWVFNESECYKTSPLKINLVNGAGAGDSMITGFSYKTLEGQDIVDALDFANACGAGTASVKTIADKDTIDDLFKKIIKNKKEKYA